MKLQPTWKNQNSFKLIYLETITPGTFVWPTKMPDIQYQIQSDLDTWLTEVSSISPTPDIEEEEEEDKIKLHCEKLRLEQLYYNTVVVLCQP
jgi:hypothetical protein